MDEAWPTARRCLPRRHDLPIIVGGGIVVAVVLMAVLAPLISPHDPLAQVLPDRLKPPAWLPGGSPVYLLGTDANGRDILSRIIWGSRTSLQIGLLSVLLGAAIGLSSGLLAGYRRGWVDAIIGRLADIQQAIPLLILALAVIAVVGSSVLNLVIVLGAGSWLYYHRVVRGEVLAIRERPYVREAPPAVGAGDWRI